MKIDINRLSLLQRQNLNDGLAAYWDEKVISCGHPVALYIELTKNCIARCRFCHPRWSNAPGYNMSREIFDILMQEYVPYATFVDLRGFGESLMLGDFGWYVEQVARKCPHIRLTTTLGCGNQRALESLVDYDVFISVSFDAAEKSIYESIRRGICYDTVIKNMEFLSRQIRKKHGSLDGRMRIGIAPLQSLNLDYVGGIIDLAVRLGISEIRILPLGSHIFDFNVLMYHKRHTREILLKAIDTARRKGITLQFGASLFPELRLDERACDRCCKPWLYAVINHEGKMLYCDWQIARRDNNILLGSIKDGIDSTWNSTYAQSIRSAHIGRKDLYDCCRGCYRWGRYCDHEHEIDPRFMRWLVTDKEIEPRLFAFNKKSSFLCLRS